MAKKTTAKQNTNNGESKFKGIRNFFTSERTRFITGLVISIVTIYIGLALIRRILVSLRMEREIHL